jgi:hypothetical protein
MWRVSILEHTGSVNIGLSCAGVSVFQSCGYTACCSVCTRASVSHLPMSIHCNTTAYSINPAPIQSTIEPPPARTFRNKKIVAVKAVFGVCWFLGVVIELWVNCEWLLVRRF